MPTDDSIRCLTKRNLLSRVFIDDSEKKHVQVGRQFLILRSQSQIPIIKKGLYLSGLFHIGIECTTWGRSKKPLRMQHDGWLRLRGHDSENKSAGMKIINESWALLGSLKWDTSIYLPGGAGWRWGWGRWVEFWSNSELEAYLNKFCFWGIFWKFFEGKSHNPDKITRFLGYPSYPDKIDKNWPKNNPDIRSFFPRYTS